MCALVNGNSMCICGKEAFADLLKVAAAYIEDGDDATFSRNVKPTETLVKGEHVGIGTDRLSCRRFLAFEIEYDQLRVLFACCECQTMLRINQQTMAALAARQRVTCYHLVRI